MRADFSVLVLAVKGGVLLPPKVFFFLAAGRNMFRTGLRQRLRFGDFVCEEIKEIQECTMRVGKEDWDWKSENLMN